MYVCVLVVNIMGHPLAQNLPSEPFQQTTGVLHGPYVLLQYNWKTQLVSVSNYRTLELKGTSMSIQINSISEDLGI